jgi:serine/threonine protein kinase
MDKLVDRMLGRYKILKVLGEGGMGVVLKARDVTLQRDVAIKVLHPHLSRQPNLKERFLQEARSAARLDHPSIVKVFDFGKEGAVLYIVMEFIAGANLRQLLEELKAAGKWVVLDEALGIMQEVCLALDHAHKQGVLHRDIKPGNIMLKPEPCDGLPYRPVLTDLGLAKLLEGTPITQEGTSMGTPAYMSPEQALGRPTDARSDVYSLGVLLFELTVGRLPFPAKTITEAIRYHTQEPPPQPRSIQPDLPLFLERVILRAMAKDPDRRFPDTATMAQALEAISPTVAQIAASTVLEGAASLVTQLQQTLAEEPVAPVRDLSPTPPPDLAEDNIQITGPDGKTRLIPVQSERMTIGRAEDNDIVVDDTIVSGHHARIHFDGQSYFLIDLDSRNGTFLGNSKLLPGTPEEWPPRIPVRIGKSFLHLVRGQQPVEAISVPAGETAMVRPDGSRIEPRLIRSSPGDGRLSVFMEQNQLSVEPGSSVTASILLLNRGTLVDNFQISLEGIPAGWVPSMPPTIRLMPDAQQPASIVISPPRSPQSAAGDYPLTIRVTSVTFPDQIVDVEAKLTVLPFFHFSSTLHPQRLRPGTSGAIKIKNEGNQEQAFSLTWEDRGDELSFEPAEARVTAGAGQEAAASFSALLRQRRWVGSENVHPFVTKISTSQGVTQTQPGEVISRGVIPPWILPLLFLGCIALAAALAWAYQGFRDQFAEATRALQAEETVHALAYAATQTATIEAGLGMDTDGDGLTDVRESELGTDPSKADTDGDGLTDQEEASLGTLPTNPDSDGDGLSDGDERRYGSDPWVVDTDGDTVADGIEVNGREVAGQIFYTSPINPDTDGDGLPDNVDPDPGNQPTPTLEPTATPTATPTASPEATATPTPPASPTPTATGTASPTPTASPTTWFGGVIVTGVMPINPVIPGVLVPLNQVWEHDFHLVGSRTIYYLRLTEPGTISARAVWSGSQSNLALIIGADGGATTVRQDGPSGLVATWTVTPAQFEASRVWRVTVASFGSGSANGTMEITYPSGSTVTPFSGNFTIAEGYASSVTLLVLNRAGTVKAEATWAGTPVNLALILNGPGQVGAYVREDGPTGLNWSYAVSQTEFETGDTWRVSLVSFSQANATGTVNLTHP